MSSNSSVLVLGCSSSSVTDSFNYSYNITSVCVRLPLAVLVLILGHRQWWQQRSFQSVSHSDVFIYNNALLDLTTGLATVGYLCGIYFNLVYARVAGFVIPFLIFSGETSFHVLTCVERHLAVVHPIVYLRLRDARGVRLRNAGIACAWLLCLVWSLLIVLDFPTFPTIHIFCLLCFSIVIVSFCSVSVLYVLVRPGPGDGGRDRVDPSKQAFLTIMAIAGVLWLWFGGYLVLFALGFPPWLCEAQSWMLRISGSRCRAAWFYLCCSSAGPGLCHVAVDEDTNQIRSS